MRILVGVPMRVLIPPTLDARTSGISSDRGLMPSAMAIWMVMGVMSSIVVTLSSKAEATEVMSMRIVTSSQARPPDSL